MFKVGEEHRHRDTRIFKFLLDRLYRTRRNHYLRQTPRSCWFSSCVRSREVLSLAKNYKAALLNGKTTIDVWRLDCSRYSRTHIAPDERLLYIWQIGLCFFPVSFHRPIYPFSHFLVKPPWVKNPHCGIITSRMLVQ